MGRYQGFKGNPENKLFYIIDQLVGGINTDFSDDTSPDNEFYSIVNFNMDKRGSLYKRLGFGKLDAISEIFSMFERLPDVKGRTTDNPNPELTNDNIMYMKMLRNDNNCFRNLSAYSGEKAYRDYQRVFGGQNNLFRLMLITSNKFFSKSTAWILECELPELSYDEHGQELEVDTIRVTATIQDLPVLFSWDKTMSNVETLEFYDKIHFTSNDSGLLIFDRTTLEFSLSGRDSTVFAEGVTPLENSAYKPTPMEIRKIGFNLLGRNPLTWIDYQGITTDSIQGIFLTFDEKPTQVVPNGGKFRINVLYTGEQDFTITFKEGEKDLTADVVKDESTGYGLYGYDVTFKNVPTSEVEIKVVSSNENLDEYYDYYTVGPIDTEAKIVENLNVGRYGIIEMYNRAVFYADDTIWFSEINNFNYIPNYNYVSLPIEPTDKITKIVFFRNVYIVFTKHRIYKMIGSFGSSDFQVMPVNLSVGCHAPKTVVPVENELYFASPRGLYSLKSSDYLEGIENLRELDTKIKKITSDSTLYVKESFDPTIRYAGLSEKATAVRYKDKYMIFLNNYDEPIDNELIEDIDVLVYQYDLKAFSTIRFPIKPTFVFMIDGVLETFMSVAEKEEYTVEETILEYDFEVKPETEGVIKDLSGNDRDAIAVGGVVASPGVGVHTTTNKEVITIDSIVENTFNESDFQVDLSVDLENTSDCKLVELKPLNPTVEVEPDVFEMETYLVQGIGTRIKFVAKQDYKTRKAKVDYVIEMFRESVDVKTETSAWFSLKTDDKVTLIPYNGFRFFLTDSILVQEVYSGSFEVSYDMYDKYEKTWIFEVESSYPVTRSGWDLGSDTSFDKYDDSPWSGSMEIRVVGTAEAQEGGALVTYTPYLVLRNYPLYTGVRYATFSIGGYTHNHTLPAVSHSGGTAQFSMGQQTQFIPYDATSKSISISGNLAIRAELAGVWRENMPFDAFTATMPSAKSYEFTEWILYIADSIEPIKLSNLEEPSSQAFTIGIEDNSVYVEVDSTNGYSRVSVPVEAGINNIKARATSGVMILEVNDQGGPIIPFSTLDNIVRDASTIANGMLGSIYSFTLSSEDVPVISYDFSEGSGNIINDNVGLIDAALSSGIEWLVETGIKFDGKTGYLTIPELLENIPLTNGMTIEFEGKFDQDNLSSKIMDFAINYDTSEEDKASINIGFDSNTNSLSFETSSVTNRKYSISDNNNVVIDERAKWKITVLDNGKNYDISLYKNDELISTTAFNYGGITNTIRKSNLIGRSNNPNESFFKGVLYNFKMINLASSSPIPIYKGTMFEYETTTDDFGQPMDISLETKGVNLQYPMHLKKVKNILIKGLGGYNFTELFFEVYADGHILNDPKTYRCYTDDVTKQVVYDYVEVKELTFNEKESVLGNMRLDNTKLGKSTYETRKLIVPGKGKNFTIKIYGTSADSLNIESIGFVAKLGKVREG